VLLVQADEVDILAAHGWLSSATPVWWSRACFAALCLRFLLSHVAGPTPSTGEVSGTAQNERRLVRILYLSTDSFYLSPHNDLHLS
jgi:hypothetical protein